VNKKVLSLDLKNRESLIRTVWTVSRRQTVLKTGKHAYYYYKGTDASLQATEADTLHIKYNVLRGLRLSVNTANGRR